MNPIFIRPYFQAEFQHSLLKINVILENPRSHQKMTEEHRKQKKIRLSRKPNTTSYVPSIKSSAKLLFTSILLLSTSPTHAARRNQQFKRLRNKFTSGHHSNRHHKKQKQAATAAQLPPIKLDPDKDSLVNSIISQQFPGEDVRVVNRAQYLGQVGATLQQNSQSSSHTNQKPIPVISSQSQHAYLQHGDRYINNQGVSGLPAGDINRLLPSIKGRQHTITLGETLQDLAGGGQRLVEECGRVLEKT